ncbi:MAG: hypothetical protein KF764_04860 [Labilithrix sp.]|nr:hypothetical protein [Labilithrix sp.]
MSERKQATKRVAADTIREALAAMKKEPSAIAGGLVFFAVIAFWVWRVQKGVDLSDESFYLGQPLRFALGDRPFFDERSSLQGAGLIELPIVALYHFVVKSNAGLMLFMRLVYLTFLTAIGVGLASAVRGWISRGTALACGAIACFFVPYCIYQLSYNTLGGGLAMLAGLTVVRLSRTEGTTARAARRYAMFAGVCVASAALAYPTLLPLAGVHAITLVSFGRKPLGWWRTLAYYAMGGGAVCLYVCLFLLRSGFGSIKLTIEFVRAWGPSLTGEVSKVPTAIEGFKQDWFYAFLVVSALAILARRVRLAVFVLALYLPTLALPTTQTDTGASMRFFTCLSLFAPVFALLVEDRRRAFQLLASVWVPGIIVGTLTGISSSNGGIASGLGGFAGVLVGAILASRACEEAIGRWRGLLGGSSIAAPLAVLWALVKLATAENAVYRDDPLDKLTDKVRVGPYKGLKTTAEHRKVVEQMHADIVEHAGDGQYALFLTDFPSGYLSANRRGAIVELWSSKELERNKISTEIFRERSAEVSLVGFRSCGHQFWRACNATPSLRADNPLIQAVTETHVVAVKRPEYTLLKPR